MYEYIKVRKCVARTTVMSIRDVMECRPVVVASLDHAMHSRIALRVGKTPCSGWFEVFLPLWAHRLHLLYRRQQSQGRMLNMNQCCVIPILWGFEVHGTHSYSKLTIALVAEQDRATHLHLLYSWKIYSLLPGCYWYMSWHAHFIHAACLIYHGIDMTVEEMWWLLIEWSHYTYNCGTVTHLPQQNQGDGMEFAADIEWNFVKFVINRDGEVVKRFPSPFDRAALEQEIELLL